MGVYILMEETEDLCKVSDSGLQLKMVHPKIEKVLTEMSYAVGDRCDSQSRNIGR